MKKIIIASLLLPAFLARSHAADAPAVTPLKECLKVAVEKSALIRKANLNKQYSEFQIDEALSGGLPKIDAFVQSLDNVKKSVMLLPGSLMGRPGTTLSMEVGTQYSTSAGIKFNQLLYSQTYFLSLSVSRKLYEVNSLNVEKVKSDIIYDLTKIYALASTTERQIHLIQNNINRLDSIIYITKAQVENGYAKSVDLDRVIVGKSNYLIQLDNINSLYKLQIDLLKYYIDMPKETEISVSDTLSSLLVNGFNFKDFSPENRNEVKLLSLQKDLYNDNLSAVKYEYLPNLSFIGQFQYQNMREDYKLFGTQWFGSGYIGLNLNIPVFDGFNKNARINQAQVNLLKSDLDLQDTKKYLSTALDKAERDYNTNSAALSRQKENVELARKILTVSSTKFAEGNMSMSDLLNDETNLSSAEQNYLNTKLQLLNSELDLLKAVGKLEILLNN